MKNKYFVPIVFLLVFLLLLALVFNNDGKKIDCDSVISYLEDKDFAVECPHEYTRYSIIEKAMEEYED